MNADAENPCLRVPCLPMCCPVGRRLVSDDQCVALNESTALKFPTQYDPISFQSLPVQLHIENFHVFTWNPCPGGKKIRLQPEMKVDEEFMFLSNGFVYMTRRNLLLDYESFCFTAIADHQIYDVILCFPESEDYNRVAPMTRMDIVLCVCIILSVPFLLLTFIIYSLIPELRNLHGCTLRGYVSSLILLHTVVGFHALMPRTNISHTLCILIAFIIYFSTLSAFAWLNVMGFDIWWTFGGFRSIQDTVKEQEKKKLIMYTIYALGSAGLLTGACAIMDFVPSIRGSFISPGFVTPAYWFTSDLATGLYFYGPIGIILTCSICLFISTTKKIRRHKMDTARLEGMESQRHDDNKQWLTLYLKLFFVTGMHWLLKIIYWHFGGFSVYVWSIFYLTNSLQGIIVFIIFVGNNKIKKLLLKRLGCQNEFPIETFNDMQLSQSNLERHD